MKAIFKRYGWIVLLLFVCGGVLSLGYNFLQDLFFERGLAAAKGIYEQQIADAEADAAKARKEKLELAEKAGRERERLRLEAEAEIRRINNVFAIFKSETAAELRDKNATIGEVLAEKEKDEIVIIESKETILYLAQFVYGTLFMWKAADVAIESAHQREVDALTLKYSSCQEWSAKLEAKLKPSFWKYARDGALVTASFMLGRASK